MSGETLSAGERASRICHGLNVLGALAAPHLLREDRDSDATDRRGHWLRALDEFIEAAAAPPWQESAKLAAEISARIATWDGTGAPPREAIEAARVALARAGVPAPPEGWDAWQGPDSDEALDDARSGLAAANHARAMLWPRLARVAAPREFERWLAAAAPGEVRDSLLGDVERFLQLAPVIDRGAARSARQEHLAELVARSRPAALALAALLRSWPDGAVPDAALRRALVHAARDYLILHTIGFDEDEVSLASWHAWWDAREDV